MRNESEVRAVIERLLQTLPSNDVFGSPCIVNPDGPAAVTFLEALLAERQAIADAERTAFTFAYARGFKTAEETSRSCIGSIDCAWAEYLAANEHRSADDGL